MTFLPIAGRELRVAARKRATWWTRVGAVALAMIVLLFVFGIMHRGSPPAMARGIFGSLAGLALLYCLLVGVLTTADCISEERREGTLGLLFLTNLRGYDVVIGKLIATSLHAVYGLVAILPVMVIPLLMGGLTGDDVWRVALVLFNTLFLSLAAGMFVSCMVQGERSATAYTFFLLAVLTGGLPLAGYIGYEWAVSEQWISRQDEVAETFLLPFFLCSPGFSLFLAFVPWAGAPLSPAFWWSLLASHVLAWGMILLACARVPHLWKDKALSVRSLRLRERWKQWCYGDGAERARYHRRLIEINPCYWLAARDRLLPWMVWLFLAVVATLWLWSFFRSHSHIFDPDAAILFCYPVHVILKVWMIREACARFGADRRSGALELILATPVPVNDLLRGQWLALLRQFLWPTAFILAVEFAYSFADSDSEWKLVSFSCIMVGVADFWAIGWVGLWQGLVARKAGRAAAAVMARLLVLPWGLLFGIFLLIAINTRNRFDEDSLIIFWLAISLAVDAIFGLRAMTQLKGRFREIVAGVKPGP
jgi:ABC-type transport system involved in cytochrome c biogenesis permease component